MKNWLQVRFIGFLTKHLFNAVTEDDFLHVRGRNIFYRGQKLSAEQRMELVSGAKLLRSLESHKIILLEMKNCANDRIYNKSRTTSDLVFGKAMLYALDVLEKKIVNLSSLE